MWRLVTIATYGFFIAVLASPVHAAKDAGKCTAVKFKDPLGIRNCLGESFNVCNLKHEEQVSAAHKLARCFTNSQVMPNFVFWILSGMREAVLFALHLASPNGAQILYPLLEVLTMSIRAEYAEARMLPTHCEQKINVSFPKAANIAQCTTPINLICTRWNQLHASQAFTLLLSSVVCVYKKFPQFNILDLLREVSCLVLQALVNTLKRRQVFSPMLPALEVAQLVFRCKVHEVFNEKAERRLLNTLSSEI